jgi:hypothetical protein
VTVETDHFRCHKCFGKQTSYITDAFGVCNFIERETQQIVGAAGKGETVKSFFKFHILPHFRTLALSDGKMVIRPFGGIDKAPQTFVFFREIFVDLLVEIPIVQLRMSSRDSGITLFELFEIAVEDAILTGFTADFAQNS